MKLTKKSYNRRMFALGALLFLSIGLVSTGFAAFVMSKGASQDLGGNIQVGTITDGSVKIENLAYDGANKILFEAAKDDDQGQVKWDENNPTQFENLTVTLTGEVSPINYVDSITISLTSSSAGIEAAAAPEKAYIELPECWESPVEITDLTRKSEDTSSSDYNVYVFSYDIKFKWGKAFNYENPSIFLDRDDAKDGAAYSFEEKRDIMFDFKKTIYAMEASTTIEDAFAMSADIPFTATISVTSKV